MQGVKLVKTKYSHLELLFLTVLALPNASKTGLDYRLAENKNKCCYMWCKLGIVKSTYGEKFML
ncbi:hypothetical protein V6Z11_A05G224400 [Gossypium hirsutum]